MITDNLTLAQLQNMAITTMPKGSHVWLYGSRARGTNQSDSDWDLLILLDKKDISQEDYELYCFPFVTLGWQHGADVSPQLYTISEWKERSITPFYQNVEQDKRVVYGSWESE